METEKIINEISNLPPEAQRQVKDFVDFLRVRYKKQRKKSQNQTPGITNEAFFGIWKDREEMKDSGEWLRTIRKTEWREPSA